MKKILITGGEGLIGSSCIEFFIDKGWSVISVDNNMRGKIFGEEGSIENNVKISKKENLEMVRGDIRNKELMEEVIKKVDAIIHCAAQPSHPRSLEIPLEDFDINAYGTLLLLETVRKNNPNASFGVTPNLFISSKFISSIEFSVKSILNNVSCIFSFISNISNSTIDLLFCVKFSTLFIISIIVF